MDNNSQCCPVEKWDQAFPGKPLPTDKDAHGEKLIKGKWQKVVYVTKDGTTPFLFDILDEDGQSIEAPFLQQRV